MVLVLSKMLPGPVSEKQLISIVNCEPTPLGVELTEVLTLVDGEELTEALGLVEGD